MSGSVQSASDDRGERAERLFEEALLLPLAARARFVTTACAGDVELAAELLSLLEHARAGEQFFGRLAEVVIPPVMPSTMNAGRFEIRGLIGAGGMGTVYRAHDARLDRDVALKFLPPHLGVAPDAEGRLLREARAAAGLEHVNICTVYEIGETDEGLPFIAMALYEGETLKERLARGPLPIADAIDIAVQVARGLATAHAQGIVHRDVKPGNIMLTSGGTVKLLDFGLATMPDADHPAGITPGTVPYMSPEQTRGEPVGPRSDLWSLGVVLYEMLSGVRPFSGETNAVVVDAIRHAAVEPLSQRAAASASLEGVVARLLDKDPDRRYRDADELIADLARELPMLGRSPMRLRNTSRAWQRGVLALLALVAVAVGATAAWWRGHRAATGAAAGVIAEASPRTLALLPFRNESQNPENAYVAEGLTQELTRALSRLHSVRVVSRRSAASFTNDQRDLQAVGRALKVGALVVGDVQDSSGALRVQARLINVHDGVTLWSETYASSATAIGTLQRELALRIANALQAKLSPAERDRLGRPGTRSAEALARDLKGRYFANQRTAAAYRLAIGYFEQAIAADSQYAAPWAGLAAIYTQQGMSGQLSPRQARERSRAAALRAISLDDSLAEAHAVLGVYLHDYEWDSDAAERESRRAIELDPNYATAYFYYGILLRSIGRLDEAVAQQSTAIELDPLVPAFNETLALTLLSAGRADAATARARTALELDSTYWRAHAVLGCILEATHRYADAIREYERANQLAGPSAHRTTGDLARVLALIGRRQDARHLLDVLQSRAERADIYEPAVATAFHALGDDAAAYDWLEHSYRQRQPELRFIDYDPRFVAMSSDSRFVDLMHRLRLPR
ncbi:MAG TPA: protein kinase [Gemmatimonadaceae bacterium]|nr:protein kinase [Gemmatimonadaceae bacterium]